MASVTESASPDAIGRADHYGPVGRSTWLDEDWNRHQKWVEVRGSWVNVIDVGEGDPVVFIHGLAGSWQNWIENILPLAEDHRVILLDLPGFGHSPMPRDKITIHSYAEIVADLLGELGISAACVVGNSMGGFIAADLAISEPQLVERLVLVSAAGITSEHQRTDFGLRIMDNVGWIIGAYLSWWAAKSDWIARRPRLRKNTFAIVSRHPGWLPAPLVAEQLRGSGKKGFVPALDALTSYPIRDRLPQIACPTLIVWGSHDVIVPTKDADRFMRAIPGSRKVIYADTAHVPMLERPDRFNADLRAFLADPEGDDVGHATQEGAHAAEVARTGDPDLDGED